MRLPVAAAALALVCAGAAAASPVSLVFACEPGNDLYQALGAAYPRADSPAEAIRRAPRGAGVLILADGYPDRPTAADAALFEAARRKRVRVFIEYPSAVP